jgi:mannose-6-phosphate isomerase-like protein (cupin superfamily)
MTMQATLALMKKSIRSPDETRSFPNGKVEILRLEDHAVALVTLRPGWQWSRDVRRIEKTENCLSSHLQYVISGRLMVQMQDGMRIELRPGDFVSIPPGHDAWVLGDEPFLAIDLTGMTEYAKPLEGPGAGPEPDDIVGFD